MKLSAAVLLLSAMSATATKSISGKSAAKVLRAARRVEENNEDEAEEGEYDYLMKYTLKMVSCKAGETVVNPENGEYEYNAVVVRLCPTESGCDDTEACEEGFGDFVVGLNTFVDAYFEDQRDNMNWDDQFEVDKYAQCDEYEIEAGEDDANADQWENYQFFIGPTCTEEGNDVKLALFQDEACTYESEEISFETISNGWTLPYSSGGLVSTSCIDCVAYDEDEGGYELREMCEQLYMESGSKCESGMEYYSYYGQNNNGCEYIEEINPAKKSGGNGGKVFGWIVFVALVGGLAGYIVWWRKKKSGSADLA